MCAEPGAPKAPGPAVTPRKRSNPWIVAVMSVFIAGLAVVIWFETRPKPPELPPTAYYTTDDGKTLFADDAERIPPFDRGGKPAVRAHVFSCDGGKTRFVAYMEKIPDEAFTQLRAQGKDPLKMDDDDIAELYGWAVKRPGDSDWANSLKDPDAYQRVIRVTCPEGRVPLALFPQRGE